MKYHQEKFLMNKLVFIADDDKDILEIMSLILKTHGYDVQTTTNANILFDLPHGAKPDLIILDIWMSGIDGRDIFVKIKKDGYFDSIPILFMSASAQLDEIIKQYPAEGYIAKPFEMDYLISTVSQTMQHS